MGEIEHALLQIDGIKECRVIARERAGTTGAQKYLAAYYVPGSRADAPSPAAIKDELARLLPDYMMPAACIEMDALPLTVNGKLNTQALPDPGFSFVDQDYAPPTTDTEITLCNLWQEVLGLERVGIHNDFFKVGGDSILSIQIASRARQAGLGCYVKDIFESKTIARLAAHLHGRNVAEAVRSEQGILMGGLDLLPIQQWFVESVESGAFSHPGHWNQSFLLRVPELEPAKLERIIGELADHHDALRIAFARERPGEPGAKGARWLPTYQPEIAVSCLRVLDVGSRTPDEIHRILTGWQSGFDLERGPLFQAGYLYGYQDGSARIYFAAHHMVMDAVSWRILAEDIHTLYMDKPLPRKGSSYRQWVACVKSYAARRPEEAAWWLDRLREIPAPEAGKQAESQTESIVTLDAARTRLLLQEAPSAYNTTVDAVLLTALAYALRDLNDQDVQGITLEGHGREDIDATLDISRTVGWFTTVFPVRPRLWRFRGHGQHSVHLQRPAADQLQLPRAVRQTGRLLAGRCGRQWERYSSWQPGAPCGGHQRHGQRRQADFQRGHQDGPCRDSRAGGQPEGTSHQGHRALHGQVCTDRQELYPKRLQLRTHQPGAVGSLAIAVDRDIP
ncbi:MAG: hypothetical protein E6J34_24375 [Chloroflexi bacterium]|nr:MAG: hypothetical protein E6J34_24375 [Chloroflexota bacterium]